MSTVLGGTQSPGSEQTSGLLQNSMTPFTMLATGSIARISSGVAAQLLTISARRFWLAFSSPSQLREMQPATRQRARGAAESRPGATGPPPDP